VRLLRQHGVSIVATLWLILLIAGASASLTVAFGIPCMVMALVAYVAELRERWGNR
jgi:hypothetical protein